MTPDKVNTCAPRPFTITELAQMAVAVALAGEQCPELRPLYHELLERLKQHIWQSPAAVPSPADLEMHAAGHVDEQPDRPCSRCREEYMKKALAQPSAAAPAAAQLYVPTRLFLIETKEGWTMARQASRLSVEDGELALLSDDGSPEMLSDAKAWSRVWMERPSPAPEGAPKTKTFELVAEAK